MDGGGRHDANTHLRLLTVGIERRIPLLCGCRPQLGCHRGHRSLRNGHLAQDINGLGSRQRFKVALPGRDEKAGHIQCARADKHLLLTLGTIAVGAMLAARENHAQLHVTVTPSHHIEHRFRITVGHRQRLIQFFKQGDIVFHATRTHKESRTMTSANHGDTGIVAQRTHHVQISA